VAGTGPGPGTICGCGNATHGTDQLDGVWAKIISVHAGPVSPPHPNDAKPGSVNFTDGTWWFKGGPAYEVPNAPCAPSDPGDDNSQMAVWCHFSDGTELAAQTLFAGVCSTTTNCDAPGSGPNPCHSIGSATVTQAGRVVATVAAQWAVTGQGFTTKATLPFNAFWVLALGQTARDHCRWHNGGNGTTTPLVELRCEAPLAVAWQLTFRLGPCIVQYIRPAHDWNDLGPNTFAIVATTRGHRGKLPKAINVLPV
jgi:hypothetical protein